MQLTIPALPTDEDFEILKHGLNTYKESFTSILPREKISSFIEDSSGTVFGGILGEIKWGWLYIEDLWIDAAIRNNDWGSKLLGTLEEYARLKGVTSYRLETTSFQTLGFYTKMGYTQFGELLDYPPGHTSYFLKKQVAL
ncbi:MAG: GNAT family N-acetyltransferase [Pseudomonadota bacterium]